jgi:hypothetical protein
MELKARGVAIDLSLRYLKYHLLYEPCDLRASQLEQLYQVGFRDIDELDYSCGNSVLGNSFAFSRICGSILQYTLERSM